jgi:hypothetical protein
VCCDSDNPIEALPCAKIPESRTITFSIER